MCEICSELTIKTTTTIYLVAISYLKVMKRAASDKHRQARKIKESDKK